MFHKLDDVISRFEKLTEKLGDPTLYDRPKDLREVNTERSNLEPIVNAYRFYKKLTEDVIGSKEILKNETDPEMREMAKEELAENEQKLIALEAEIKILLLPKNPIDEKNVMIEIRAGAGGDEASIFVGDVYRMYQNFFKSVGFKSELVSISQGDEGIKEIIFSVSGEKVYSKMKFEGGVHRVQRVPKTETQGRVHTSTITVAVLPEAEEVDFELDMNECRIDVYRSGGAGGQSVNTTDSAVRLTHIPTGIVIAMQDERSQLKNKDKAIKILRNKLYERKVQEQHDKEQVERQSMVGTGDRSERIRTYNFPQGRLTDHRINLTLYSLDKIIDGDLAPVVDALVANHQAELLKGVSE